MTDELTKIYNNFFTISETNISLESLSSILKKEFTIQEISYLVECVERDIDFEALELGLRDVKPNNIVSFVLLRLSALAESIPENQSLYINAKPLTLFQVFVFLSTTVINFLLLKIKSKLVYQNLINEYPNV